MEYVDSEGFRVPSSITERRSSLRICSIWAASSFTRSLTMSATVFLPLAACASAAEAALPPLCVAQAIGGHEARLHHRGDHELRDAVAVPYSERLLPKVHQDYAALASVV